MKVNLATYLPCEISSSHGGEYDVQNCLLGCTALRQYIPEDNSEHRTYLPVFMTKMNTVP
jgi:hypothetical protein